MNAVAPIVVDESSSNSPVQASTPNAQHPDPDSCTHPRNAQSLEELDDGQYARSCRCGVVLDHWRNEDAMQAGLERLASTWRVPVDELRGELDAEH